MRRIFNHITQFARSKTPEEWKGLVRQRIEEIRALVRKNGEKAALGAFGLGIVIVLFFKLFIVLLAVVVLIFLILLAISESGR